MLLQSLDSFWYVPAIQHPCQSTKTDPQPIPEFPLSQHFRSQPLSSAPITLAHLRISPQTPQTWHLNSSHTNSLSNAITTLLYRARLEAELQYLRVTQPTLFPNLKAGETFKVGRIGIATLKNYEAYREIALRKLGVDGNEVEVIEFGAYGRSGEGELGADWEDARFLLQVWWTLRCLIGPVGLLPKAFSPLRIRC